ncbi:MAG: hypothetical protein ABR606_06955 [Vicinamibacterales bacterium]
MGAIAGSAGVALHADTSDRSPFTRVRGADAETRRLIAEAADRSRTFRTMIDEIQRSNALVIVQFGLCGKGRFRSCVSAVEGDHRQRHIRILVSTRTTGDRLLATIAHELQHALEIVREADVIDGVRALALYRRIATGDCGEGLSEACETDAALAVEAKVLEELHRASQNEDG